MDMIAEKCEISKPTLYNYFESKSSLFLGLFSRFQSEIAEKSKVLMGQKKDKYLIIEEIHRPLARFRSGKARLPKNDDPGSPYGRP